MAGGPLKTGVIGAGAFGRNHLRKLIDSPRAEVVGVFDQDSAAAEATAAELSITAQLDLKTLLDHADAVVVAVPASFHYELAEKALRAGKHCLVEKPLAPTLAEANRLVAQANDGGLVLQVGHQERYVFQAMGLLSVDAAARSLTAVREGPASPYQSHS